MPAALERLFLESVSRPALSRWAARLADARLPRPLLRALLRVYIRAYTVDLNEAAEPLEAFETFNAFFTRRLKAGARPIDTRADVLVAPCDARLQASGPLPADGRLEQIKGRDYALADLLGSAAEAERLQGGFYATLYLSPAMYHRVHVPVEARLRSWRYLPGRLYPVNSLAVRHVPNLFAVNERMVVHAESAHFGPLALVLVGAANVGRIGLSLTGLRSNCGHAARHEQLDPPREAARGDELGVFNLGSTVVLVAGAGGLRLAPDVRPGQLVRVGQALLEHRAATEVNPLAP